MHQPRPPSNPMSQAATQLGARWPRTGPSRATALANPVSTSPIHAPPPSGPRRLLANARGRDFDRQCGSSY